MPEQIWSLNQYPSPTFEQQMVLNAESLGSRLARIEERLSNIERLLVKSPHG